MPAVERTGVPIHYESSGAGTPVLLLHGLGSSTEDWAFQVPAFSARHQTITMDVRGHGRSGKPPGPYRIGDFAADAAAALEAAAPSAPAHLVGISMGGMVALQIAVDRPELARSLVIVNSGPEVRGATLKQRLLLLQRRVLARVLSQRTLGRAIAGRLFPRPEQAPLRTAMEERWARNEKAAYIASVEAILRWSVADRLPGIRQRTLVISGDRDYTPVDAKRAWAARMRDARVAVLADSGHGSPLDQPEAFNRMVLEFLADVDR